MFEELRTETEFKNYLRNGMTMKLGIYGSEDIRRKLRYRERQ